ncbi:unnamed protein product [Caenorhabditis sp. 36 PRJEB53466]|nr:unnamed protein product [Caenorhabditis sp. 36 PRJEB53466]
MNNADFVPDQQWVSPRVKTAIRNLHQFLVEELNEEMGRRRRRHRRILSLTAMATMIAQMRDYADTPYSPDLPAKFNFSFLCYYNYAREVYPDVIRPM